ncbi:TIGR02611 family protein [Blastococcus sp. DSM 46786]|uniref:PGPGW domain-containing protein n=1 Tax=Blastococcus sp. DSM 46786 TaxID=1798227 RepID=UPI0008BB026E|nr:PGPGW domain-containing protein [Blastococcus sp. DSM 46786]SEL07716.1 TIGR02611 family protein [Blastococcus sp. DSM 46786]
MEAVARGHRRVVKTVAIAVLGAVLTLSGIALLVLPGPGFVLVAAGLAVLATRFPWARKPLDYAKEKAQEGVEEVGRNPWRAAGAVLSALVLVGLGAVTLAGVDLPFVNAFTAVVLILSGLFLLGTVVFARHEDNAERARAHRPAGAPQGGGAYRAARPAED